MKSPHRLLVAAALLAAAGVASAQEASPDQRLTSLRGFRMGTPCMNLNATYEGLLAEGFTVGTPAQSCFLRPGEYRIDRTLKQQDGKSELIEVYFAPDSTVWRTRVSLTWEGIHRLAEKPTPEQVQASLLGRFGAAYTVTRDRALLRDVNDAAHGLTFAWSTKVPADGPGTMAVDSFGWNRWTADLKGVVTLATLRWSDDATRQTLVVEQTNRWVLPFAAEAQAEAGRQEAARKAKGDASQLGKL